jgi:hypothetical protein
VKNPQDQGSEKKAQKDKGEGLDGFQGVLAGHEGKPEKQEGGDQGEIRKDAGLLKE